MEEELKRYLASGLAFRAWIAHNGLPLQSYELVRVHADCVVARVTNNDSKRSDRYQLRLLRLISFAAIDYCDIEEL